MLLWKNSLLSTTDANPIANSMRFRSLSSKAALTLGLVKLLIILSAEADSIANLEGPQDHACTSPPKITNTLCSYSSFSSCSTCAGRTSCCSESNSYYGTCDDISNLKCPDGNDATCFGAQCPNGLSCKFAHCPDFAEFCWGTTVCDGELSCSNLQGLFCNGEKSNSQEFYVCCSTVTLDESLHFNNVAVSNSVVAMNSTNSFVDGENSLEDAGRTTLHIIRQRLLIEKSAVSGKIRQYCYDFTCSFLLLCMSLRCLILLFLQAIKFRCRHYQH